MEETPQPCPILSSRASQSLRTRRDTGIRNALVAVVEPEIPAAAGRQSIDYTVFEPARDGGLRPGHNRQRSPHGVRQRAGMPFLAWVMSKFLGKGCTLEQVAEMATVEPAQVIDRVEGPGTLRVGAPDDVSILELVREPVEFVDTRNNRRSGDRWLKPVQTVKAGRPFGRPFPVPFAWP